ncbi:DUF4189 domain-containing protein [Nocardia asteroides]|uniref:DUF4189 domain-containing protein n=1 Tax=Nocardia asteroides NBRC 15531 TaxID=1110697 RepID=U5ECM4_NOCAS|nr:DUF4189 domain-containing protein [Nocardia asteroides]TLF64261.1 DUF4189 domain-containing protein [Nocardia asteroides NBRC 15531]UGT50634.1 DUF4189 domain-containing protein [Nocardia asteroides]SFN32205.1 protein of unknown function [Nocardia asteroides]VEG36543.1 Uncharacterised protein [Nocardia asteroides]GAD84188.1 hypothetical protein NCAST_21_01390 [Nocardia asteroides NBRC 15531]
MSLLGKAAFAVAALGLTAGSVFGAGAAKADGLYAAFAVSDAEWVYGVGVNEASYADAEAVALDRCGVSDCQVMLSWANGCGVLVESEDGIAVASRPTRAEAEQAAYEKLSEITPTARLANFGSSNFSGAETVRVVCTANAG